MSERKEKLSAFIDDALHRDEVMSFSLSAEAEDADVIQRYQMVGEALRDQVSEASFIDVSAAVRDALAGENIAEQIPAAHSAAESPARASGDLAADDVSGFLFGSWLRPAGGVALAAAAAVVMVTTLSQPESDADGNGPFGSPVAQDLNTSPVETVVRAKGSPADMQTVPVSNQLSVPAEMNSYPSQTRDQEATTHSAIYDKQVPVEPQNEAVRPGMLLDSPAR